MHFRINEVLETADAELLVSTLEAHLGPLAKSIVRAGNELIAFGIGPSPRTKNGNDRAIFQVRAGDAVTFVTVDVNYQASGLLGGTSQDEVVRDKILGALQEASLELRYRSGAWLPPKLEDDAPVGRGPVAGLVEEGARVAAVARFAPTAPAAPALPASPVAPAAAMAPPSSMAPAASVAPAAAVAPALIEPVVADKVSVPAKSAVVEVQAAGKAAVVAEKAEVPAAGAAASALASGVIAAKASEPAGGRAADLNLTSNKYPAEDLEEKVEARSKRGWIGWVVAAILLLGGAGGWIFTHPLVVQAPVVGSGGEQGAAAQDESKGDGTQGSESNGTAVGGAAPGVVAVSESPEVHEPELTVWLQNWAAAAESKDAEVQTAFYADPVDWYFRTPRVSHAALLLNKRASMEDRDSGTMLKVEGVVITRQTEEGASVRFTKRYIQQTGGAKPAVHLVQAALKVRRIGGDWKIVEEHNLQ